MHLLIPLALAAALYLKVRPPNLMPYAPYGVVTLQANVPYRVAMRSSIGAGTTDLIAQVQQAIRTKLAGGVGVSAPTFMAIDAPPAWAPPGMTGWGRMLTMFDVTPAVSEQTSVGRAVEGLGNIEWILRLDGQDFGAPAAKV